MSLKMKDYLASLNSGNKPAPKTAFINGKFVRDNSGKLSLFQNSGLDKTGSGLAYYAQKKTACAKKEAEIMAIDTVNADYLILGNGDTLQGNSYPESPIDPSWLETSNDYDFSSERKSLEKLGNEPIKRLDFQQ